jgi:hypothetical protein
LGMQSRLGASDQRVGRDCVWMCPDQGLARAKIQEWGIEGDLVIAGW